LFIKITTLIFTSLFFMSNVMADSIEDEINMQEIAKRAQANANMPQPPVSKNKEIDMVEPVSMKLFRGRSDGWWQAIIKMSNGARISVNNEFTTVYGNWRVIGTKGNSIFVQKGNDRSTIRQLFVDMQDDTGGRPSITTLSNGSFPVTQPALMSPNGIPVPPL